MGPSNQLARAVLVTAILQAVPVARPAAAQGTAPPGTMPGGGTVSGTVTDETGEALASAVIQVQGQRLHAASDEKGRYRLTGLPAGTYTLRVLLLGYQAATQVVTVGAGATIKADFVLTRAPIPIEQVEVVVGSRAQHSAAQELAVPVEVHERETLQKQGSTETSQILQSVAPSMNFPRQSVTDANDIVRPFTMRGLSPDHTLVLVNGLRRHPSALVNTFAFGMPAGSSGVDLNAIPSSAIERIEVLRDGASAQYGSDAIAGVVNVVIRRGRFAPFATLSGGRYTTSDYPADGQTGNISGGWGIGLPRGGSLALFAEALDREATNRAWADPTESSGTGLTDIVSDDGKVLVKRNPVPQPNHHWGDGLEKDLMTFADLRIPLVENGASQLYGSGGYSFRRGTGNGFRRYANSPRNWPQIYPLGFLPEFYPDVTDYSIAGGWLGKTRGWKVDVGGAFGHNDFVYNLRNTLNVSLGPSLTTPTAWGPDSIPGTADDPGIPNQTRFYAGKMAREEITTDINASRSVSMGLPRPVNVALGLAWRHERFREEAGERASWIDGGHPDQNGNRAVVGSQVFAGIRPSDEADATRDNVGGYAEFETNVTPQLLANVAGRAENYNDFGGVAIGKLALRYQPDKRLVLRAAVNNGFRAPGISQIHFSKVVTNFIQDVPVEVGVFPVDHPASRLLGSKPLKQETSINFSGGLAATPVEGLTVTADYYNIKINDRILLTATFDDTVTRTILAGGGFGAVGGVQYFTNGLDTRTQGVDLSADWRMGLGAKRTLGLNLVVDFAQNRITRVDPLPDPLRNSQETGLLDVTERLAIEKERPDWRGTLAGDFAAGSFHSLGRVSYYGKFSSAKPGYCDECAETYGAKTLVDAELGYRVDFVDLSIGGRNLFDIYPDRMKKEFNYNGGTFPWAAASPFGYNGRYLYARASLVEKK